MHSDQSDQPGTTTIIRRVQRDGNEESWEQFVRRYERVIIEYAVGSGLRRDHAEDLRQTVLMELVSLLPTLSIDPDRGSFRSILRIIVKRRCIDLHRRHYRESELRDQLSTMPRVQEETHWKRAWHEGLMKQALFETSKEVNPEAFQSFELTTISSVPAREVAKMLGISTDSVYQNKLRVKRGVEQHFQRLCDEADGYRLD